MSTVRELSFLLRDNDFMVRRSFLAALLALTFIPAAAFADRDEREDSRKLRNAIGKQKVLPLEEIMKRIGPELGGRIIEVEAEADDGKLIYEIYVLTPQGRRMEIYVDPVSGRIIKREDDD